MLVQETQTLQDLTKCERTGFPNLAGKTCDEIVAAELTAAGIEIFKMPKSWAEKREVPTNITGDHQGWQFQRSWYYWSAEGPGIPPHYAEELNALFKTEVRISGDSGGADVLDCQGFAIGSYHIDTLRGLKALALLLTKITSEAAIQKKKAA